MELMDCVRNPSFPCETLNGPYFAIAPFPDLTRLSAENDPRFGPADTSALVECRSKSDIIPLRRAGHS